MYSECRSNYLFLASLGFAIHKEKSILKPIQEIEFVFSSVTVKISITKEKTEAIVSGF